MAQITFESLPNEIILHILSYTAEEDKSTLVALSRTNRSLHEIYDPYLYQYDVRHGNYSALDWGATHGLMNTFRKALAAGAPLSTQQPWGPPISSHTGKESRLFLMAGNTCQPRTRDFRTHPISLAAAGGHEDLVRFMVERGVRVDMMDPEGITPLGLAATHGHVSLARVLLLDLGASQRARGDVLQLPLHLAAFHGHKEVFDILLCDVKERGQADDSWFRDEVNRMLVVAVVGGHIPVLRSVLGLVASVNFFHRGGMSPLHFAAHDGRADIVLLLLEAGADPNSRQKKRGSEVALMQAVRGKHDEVVRVLLPLTVPFVRTKALAYYLQHDRGDKVKMFCENDTPLEFHESDIVLSSPDETGDGWVQPLALAVLGSGLDVVKLLLAAGANPNVHCAQWPLMERDPPYRRVLFAAVQMELVDVVNALLEYGADPTATDLHNQCVLDYAIYTGNEPITNTLLDRGADPRRTANQLGREFQPHKNAQQVFVEEFTGNGGYDDSDY